MALIIIKKGKSNKTGSIPKSDDPGSPSPVSAAKGNGFPTPFVDKISLVMEPPSKHEASSMYSTGYQQLTNSPDVFVSGGKPLGGFKLVKLIALDGFSERPRLDYAYADKLFSKMRIEFNPSRLGPAGMMKLHAVLVSLMNDGWETFIKYGRIARLDITVDIQGVRMDEFLFLPPLSTTEKSWHTNGHLETLTFGKKKGHQTLVYNKKKEQLAKGKSWEGKSVVRIERCLRNPSTKKLTQLLSMPNPFAGMHMTQNMPPPPSDEKPASWSMFEDSVHVRGVSNALALLPVERRKKYRDYLKTHGKPWWDPEAIWSNWPEGVESSGLL